MGSSSGLNRASFRPHFAGRSPSFLVAALLVGFGILGFSYYSLYTQYSILEIQLQTLLESETDDRRLISEKVKSIEMLESIKKELKTSLDFKEEQLKSKEIEINKLIKKMELLKESHSEKMWVKKDKYQKLETNLKNILKSKNESSKALEELNLKYNQAQNMIKTLNLQVANLQTEKKNLKSFISNLTSNQIVNKTKIDKSLSISLLLSNLSVDTALHSK